MLSAVLAGGANGGYVTNLEPEMDDTCSTPDKNAVVGDENAGSAIC